MSLTTYLREANYKLTAPRQAVLQVLEAADRHLTSAEVLEQGRAIYPALGRATVYRTLEILIELGALRLIYSSDSAPRIACVAEGHHHLVCLGCGEAFHFDDCPIGDLEKQVAKRFGFAVKSHMLELYGLCKDCKI